MYVARALHRHLITGRGQAQGGRRDRAALLGCKTGVMGEKRLSLLELIDPCDRVNAHVASTVTPMLPRISLLVAGEIASRLLLPCFLAGMCSITGHAEMAPIPD